MMLTLAVRGNAGALLSAPVRRELRRQASRAMRAAGAGDKEVCLSLTDDAEIHELNRSYAGEDHATDVLSFSQQEGPPQPGTAVLGDVVISVETAARQAQAAGHDLLHELVHLAVHGLCHLLGYDHATAEEEQVMFGYEARLRQEALRRGPLRRVPAVRD